MAGQADRGRPPVGPDRDVAHGDERLVLLALGHQHVVERGQDPLVGGAGHDQGPPGDAEAHAEGGLVGAVAADVADDGPQRPVLQFDGVVEVAAEESPPPPGR